MNTLDTLLQDLTIGAPKGLHNLTMYPLFAGTDGAPGYLTLDEAIKAGKCRITEVSQAGTVPELACENLSAEKVLLLDGEELVGAKQNRVLNLTILIGGQVKVVIPVSCVEQGRWRHQSAMFASGERAMYARGRADKMEQVSMRMAANGERFSDQGAVWNSIAEKSARMGARSETGAAEALYEKARPMTEDFRKQIAWQAGQTGAVFAINGAIVGLDLFDSSATLAKLMPKLVESYALDAIDGEAAKAAELPTDDVRAFLDEVAGAGAQSFAAVGEGEDVRLSSPKLTGAALVAGGRVVHLSAFRTRPTGRQSNRFARISA